MAASELSAATPSHFAEQAIRIHQIFYGLAGMDNGRMVPTAEMLADRLERILGKCFG